MQFFPLVPSIAFSNKSIQQDYPNLVCTNGELQSIHQHHEERNTSRNSLWGLLCGERLHPRFVYAMLQGDSPFAPWLCRPLASPER